MAFEYIVDRESKFGTIVFDNINLHELPQPRHDDVMGRLVETLVNNTIEPATYQVVWDGLDNAGQQVSAGIYIYSLQTQGVTMTKKMVLMK